MVWNCQGGGLADCIQALARTVECEAMDHAAFVAALAAGRDDWRAWDRLVLLPEAADLPGLAAADLPACDLVPPLRFTAFHPDCCYVFHAGQPIAGGVVHHYHSMVALAAYKEGLDAGRAARWYAAATYAAAGFLHQWVDQRRLVLGEYAGCGLDVSGLFRRAGRGRCFMHTINHPTIPALFEVARALLAARGQAMFAGVSLPPDLLGAAHWPVYPEVGDMLGLPGAYLFKPAQRQKPIELPEFLDRSLALFARWPASELSVLRPLRPQLQAVRRLMRGQP